MFQINFQKEDNNGLILTTNLNIINLHLKSQVYIGNSFLSLN